jgi:copper resistance protein B
MSVRTLRIRIALMLIAPIFAAAAAAQPCDENEPIHTHPKDAAYPAKDVTTDVKPDHVPPPAPEHPMPAMDARTMRSAMAMDDSAPIATIRADRLELADGGDGVAAAWKVAASFGGDFDKLLLRSEGEHADGHTERADAEVLWDHAIAAFWDAELGLRQDFGRGAHRTWAAIGLQGLAPYGFEIGATAYVGAGERTALRFEVDYELLLTQRLILEPRIELNAYGKDDRSSLVGAGLSDAAFGLRLRYEIRREFAPYVGIERSQAFGRSADFARTDDRDVRDTRWIIGLRVWY